jgi:hypothetical protein
VAKDNREIIYDRNRNPANFGQDSQQDC